MRGMIAVIGSSGAHATDCGINGVHAQRSVAASRQAPQPRSGEPKAQGLTPARRTAAQ